ncbi:AMP-binding protein [Nitratidesulfovibrio vulgaris]|uniref:AMP-dependent synthetase and ligase n=1 Tax=Nitratidesulfovibrio vulgaris (strain DP4) TaxID=391774 RepID=A0A0H3A6A5_NITV4|nr:AMP-binding protein [Nitratidesulfovibrio vulgaris]ABM28014.1 AMP-dependent synthetase and ligase [Nitratidesulfovibrio vulgaris DP4]GEB80592.1 acetyl-CoA synthetase [Desulfovibrio desulfuricans]
MDKLTFASYDEFLRVFSLDAPETFNFAFDVLDAMANETPDRLAIAHVDDAGVRRDYTFAWLADASARLANALKARGVRKGHRVMLVLHRRIEFWVSMLALHRLGAVAIPAPAQLTPKDIVFRVERAQVRAVIVDDGITDRIEAARPDCPTLSVLVQCGGTPLPDGWCDYEALCTDASPSFPRPTAPDELACGEDPLLIFFSSGTTGMPKMVEHVHTYPLGHLVTGMYWHDLRPGDLHLTVADTGWGKAVWGKFYGQWMAGAAVFVYDFRGKFDPEALLDVVAKNGVTTFCAPPTVYRFLVRADLSRYDLSKLRHCTTAGELLNESVFHGWKAATGLSIYEGYGQTETTLQIATLSCMEAKPGSIGRPMPGWGITLLDHEGKECPAGEEGEICIRISDGLPVGLFRGYVEDAEKTASVMFDGYYHTGDKAWMDEDGYLWFLGRVDDLIKSSGYRIGPFEVESALVAHPAVVEAAVTGVPDPLRGQAVKATIVLAAGYEAGEVLTKELQDHVKKVTAPYKYPRIVEYVAELPKTISGKIKRAEIRQRDSEKSA